MRRLASVFVPAADEVYRLQGQSDPECKLFQYVAMQGHYSSKGGSQQGIYALAPSGVLLGSTNATTAKPVAEMLRKAIDTWNQLPRSKRLLQQDARGWTGYLDRSEKQYPVGGLILREYVRDLPNPNLPSDWRGTAWNQDIAWFTKSEARRFLPSTLKVGDRSMLPEPLIHRFIRCHLLDRVRGQTNTFALSEIQKGVLVSTVTKVSGNIVEIRMEGETRASDSVHGFASKLLGGARFDLSLDRFVAFELVAAGNRWGGTAYNYRQDDPGPSPLGMVFTLAGNSQVDLLAPEMLWAYGWR